MSQPSEIEMVGLCGALRLIYAAARHPDDLQRLSREDMVMLCGAVRVLRSLPRLMSWHVGLDKNCLSLSADWCTFTGRELENSLGWGWCEAIHSDDLSFVRSRYDSAHVVRESVSYKVRLRRADGEYVFVIAHNEPFYEDGKFCGYVGLAFELPYTERMISKARRGAVPSTPRSREKMHQTMKEFKSGELHSGSKQGPLVRNRKQAVAIGLSQARKAK